MRFQQIQISNLLSFGPRSPSISLEDLNVFIGPNGSGKSNLIEVINFLKAAPTNLENSVRASGGVQDLLWQGQDHKPGIISAVVKHPTSNWPIHHVLAIFSHRQHYIIANEELRQNSTDTDVATLYSFGGADAELMSRDGEKEIVRLDDIDIRESILSQRKEPNRYPELGFLSRFYERIRVFREWSIGRTTALRRPQPADQPNDFLSESLDNFGLVLNQIGKTPKSKKLFIEYLRKLYNGIDDYHVQIEGGTVQVFLHEGDFTIPATRLSDGTLRYLCLLAILCHPSPPPVICIEEPEIGLHPDIINTIAELLKLASQNSQLFITTHSDILVDALTDTPESIVVCEKENGSTTMRRLEPEKLTEWLEKYRLGELWTRGEIGGNRW